MKRATRLIANSEYTRDEAVRNAGVARDRVTVVYHGVPDPLGAPIPAVKERLALTVGVVDRANLERKGLRAFVEAAADAPDVRFVVAGSWDGDADEELRAIAPDNVVLTGWVEQDALEDLYRKASVYVQASTHEGFGMSVAEAMLAGCVPITTAAGALPEVAGDAGVEIEGRQPAAIAAAVSQAIDADRSARERARDRVLELFSLEVRRNGLQSVVAPLLDDSR
jgi:glycosyltransferase involved in cell wall biosynthesis